ncbi:hypothetical protein [Tenacibaculum xiamenense]|uniref:hypothetical protein n=1 Tax=Tenacibaculum xiamenense TaxID=1261553 RepID=UPI003895726A
MIEITKNEFRYTAPPKAKIGRALHCDSFNINLNSINLIAISPRLAIDDEILFVLMITDTLKTHPIYLGDLENSDVELLENHFQLPAIMHLWGKFEYEDHYESIDKIIYPKNYYWKNLFKNDWKLKIRKLYAGFHPKSFLGNLNKELF